MAQSRGNRERSERSLGRRRPVREPKRSILIVCEGEKTEPLYFGSMKADRDLGLTTVHIEICGEECGSAPISVVNYAIQRIEERKQEAKDSVFKLPFEQVFCVMDKDHHPSLDEALDVIKASKGKKPPIEAIISCPCFEIWFLLHFRYSAKPYTNFDELKPDVVSCLPDYDKGSDIYSILKPMTQQAITHAAQLESHNAKTSNDRVPNPSTQVHKLVKALQEMEQKKSSPQ